MTFNPGALAPSWVAAGVAGLREFGCTKSAWRGSQSAAEFPVSVLRSSYNSKGFQSLPAYPLNPPFFNNYPFYTVHWGHLSSPGPFLYGFGPFLAVHQPPSTLGSSLALHSPFLAHFLPPWHSTGPSGGIVQYWPLATFRHMPPPPNWRVSQSG